jgi:hypothetical protein
MGTEVAAVKQYEIGPAAGFEVTGTDAVDVDEFFVLHRSALLRSEWQISNYRFHIAERTTSLVKEVFTLSRWERAG